MSREKQIELFPKEELFVQVNGVRAVNTVDLYDLTMPFDGVPWSIYSVKRLFR
jgi:hypothetical protein